MKFRLEAALPPVREAAQQILDRDVYTCRYCRSPVTESRKDPRAAIIHHKVSPHDDESRALDPDNMETTCRECCADMPDPRSGKNRQYSMTDVCRGAAFSAFFARSHSFLVRRKLLAERRGLSNFLTIFGMERVPSDNQIRNLLEIRDMAGKKDQCRQHRRRNPSGP